MEFIMDLFNQIGKMTSDIANGIVKETGKVLNDAGKITGDVTNNVAEVTGDVARNTGKFVGEVSNNVIKTSSDVVQNTGKFVGEVTDNVVKVTGDVVTETGKIAGNVVNQVGKSANNIKEQVNSVDLFNDKLRKKAVDEFNQSVSKYELKSKELIHSSNELYNVREEAVEVVGILEKRISELANSPKEFKTNLQMMDIQAYARKEFDKDYFLRGHKETQRFIWEINSQSMYYRQQISEVMFNLLDSHDTERILTTAKGDLQSVKSALAFLYLQRGTPCIYYGTELALIGGPDPDCRRVMPWERVSADNDMLNFMKDLIQLRKEVAGMIQHGKVSLEEVEPDVVVVEWQYEGQILKAYFNHSKKDVVLEREQVGLISLGNISDGRLIIQPNGLVIYGEN